MGFFPVDDETLRYLERTGRSPELIDLVEKYYKEQGMFRTAESPEPKFSASLELDLSSVEPSMAGPKRPQDRILLSGMKANGSRIWPAPSGSPPRRVTRRRSGWPTKEDPQAASPRLQWLTTRGWKACRSRSMESPLI